MSRKKSFKAFFKKFFAYICFSLTALVACFFALFLVLNFLSPALSAPSDSPSTQKEEKAKPTKVFGDIFKNVKSIAKEHLSQPSSNEKSAQKQKKAPPQKEDSAPVLNDPVAENPSPAPSDKPPSPTLEVGTSPGKTPPPPGAKGEGDKPLSSGRPNLPLNEGETSQTDTSLELKDIMASFIYEPSDRKDPFEDPTIQKGQKSKGIIIIPKTPPEEYNLSEIELKGVIWNTKNQAKALFKLPGDGGFYTLQAGDKVGKKGVIFKIRESEVVIVETDYLGTGEQRKAQRIIKIKKINRVGVKT